MDQILPGMGEHGAQPTMGNWLMLGFWLGVGPVLKLLTLLRRPEEPRLVERQQPEAKEPRVHVLYFDVWRTICVALVVITHSNESYAEWNVFAVQQWVLPFLELIAGTLSATSKKPLLDYVTRLLLFTSFGSMMNLMGLLLRGAPAAPKWWDNGGLHVFFQMGFTFQLAINAAVIAPLRYQLQLPPEERPKAAKRHAICFGGAAAVLVIAMAILYPQRPSVVQDVGIPVLESVLHGLLLCAGAQLLPEARKGALGHLSWVFLYATRLARTQPRPMGPELHLGDLFMWAYCVKLVPMTGQEVIGKYMLMCWPFLLMSAGLLLKPGLFGRKDQFPGDTLAGRSRQYAAEWLATMAFLTIPCARDIRSVVFPPSWRTHMAWLHYWSLFAFMSHKAIYFLLAGRIEWYFMVGVIYAQAIPFYFLFRQGPGPAEAEQPGSALREEAAHGGAEQQSVEMSSTSNLQGASNP